MATPYAETAAAFDALAAGEAVPRSTRGYHDLIRAVHQSIVRPGASVLEVGSGTGDLLAALEPSRGRGARSSRTGRASSTTSSPGRCGS